MNCAIPDEQIKTLTAILKSDIIKLKNADREYSLIPSVQKVYKLVLNSTNDTNTALAYARLVPGLIRGIAFYNPDIEGYLAQKGFDLNKLRESIETFKNIDEVKKFVVAQSENIRKLLEIVDRQRIVLSQYETNEDTKRRTEEANRPVQFTYRQIPNSDTFQEAAPIRPGEVEPATQNLEDTTPFKQRIYNLKRAVFRSESDSESEDSGVNQIKFQGEDLFYTLMRHNDLDESLELDFFSKDVRLMTPAERNVFSNRKNNGLILLITDKNGNPLFFDEDGNITKQDDGKVVYTYPREKEQIAPSKEFPEQQEELIYHLEEAKSQVRKGAKIIFPITGILAPNINIAGFTRIKDIRLDAKGLKIQLDEVPQEERSEKIQFTEFAAKNAIWEQFLKLNGLVANSNQALEVNKPLFNDLTDLRDAVIFLLSEKEIIVDGVTIDFQTRFEYLKTFFQEVKGQGLLTIPNTRKNNLIFDKNSGTVTTIIVKQDGTKETQVYNINDAENLKEVLEAFFSDRNSQYLSVNINRNNWNSGTFYDISVRNNTLNVVGNGNYYEWIYNNVSVKAKGLNADGQFRAQNPAFVFALSRDFKYVTAQEELPVETDEVPETTPEEDDAKNINPEGSIDTDNFDFDELFRQTDLENKVTQEEIDAAEKWWAQSPLSKHIPLNRLLAIVNSNAWATFSKSGITLYKGSSAVDIYHEAWHGFTQLYLTVAEKTRLYNEVRKKPGTFKTVSGEVVKFSNASFFQIEEYLAEQFRDYARQQTPEKGSPVKNTLFRRIWNFLKSLFGGVTNKTAYVDAMSVPAVAEAFNKLYFGQVLNLQPNINNSMFNVLNSAKSVVDQTPLNLNDEDLNLIRESIDGMVIDTILKKSGIEQQSKALLFLYTENGRRILFTDIRFAFNDKLREINEQLEEDPDNYNLNNQKRILQIVVDNFGDIDAYAQNKETTGILDFYSRSSNSSISNLVSINDEDIEAETNPDVTADKELQVQIGDKKINNRLIKDYLPKELLIILSLIPDVSITEGRDADLIAGGKSFVYKRNSLGFPKVKNLGHTINAITKTLINESYYDNMLYKLGEAVDAFPVLGVLKAMLPNQDSFTQTSKTIQKQTLLEIIIGFWQAFDKAKMEAFLNRQSPQQADAEQGEKIRGNLFTIGRATNSLNNVFNNWSSNFKYKTAINRDGSILLDPAKLPRITNENASYDKVFEFLEVLGVELTDTTKKVIRSGKISLTSLKEAVLSMQRDITANKNNQDFLANPLSFFTVKVKKFTSQRTLLGKIADIEMLYSPLYNNSIVLNANGDIVTDVSMHNSMTRKTAALNSSSNLTQAVGFNTAFNEELNPFFKHSIVRSKLFDKEGKRTRNFSLFIGYHLGYQKLDEYGNIVKGLAASDLTANQKFINDFYSFMLEGIMPTLVHESKSSVYVNYIQDQNGSASLYVDANSFVDSILPSKANIIINNYIRAEYERILLFKTNDLYKKNQALNKDVIVIDSEGNKVTRKAGEVFTAFDDILSAETKESLYEDIAAGISSRDSITANAEAIAKDLRSYFEKNEALNTKRFNESSSEIGIDQNIVDRVFNTENNKNLNPQEKNNVLLRAYTVNYFIHRFEMNNFYYGDMAQYDHTKEAGTKYDAGAASGGPGFITDQWILDEINKNYPKTYSESVMRELRPDNAVKATTEILNTSIIKEDTGIRSVSLDDMINKVTELRHQREKGSKKKIKDEVTAAFEKAYGAGMKIGDGHGYINLDTYRHLKLQQDNWLPQQEALYQKIVNGEKLDENDAKFFFPTYKLQMYGDLQTEAPITALHKFSLSPLIPNVIEDSLLNDIHKVMIINNIDYITYPSGSKISNVENPVDLYEDNDRNKINMDVEFVINPVNISYLKEVTSNTNLWKAGQTFATQMRKLIVENLFLDGRIIPGKEVLVEKYLERIKAVTESLENDLLDEIGWVKNPDGTYSGSKEKLAAFLQKQLEKKNIPSYIVDLLSVTEDGTFMNDLSALPNAQIIESIIFSVISRRLINQKSYGEGLVQVPGSFWRKATESERKKWLGTNNFLPFYEYDPVRVKAMKVALTMHGDYLNLFQRKDLNGIKIGTYEFVEQEDGTTKKVLNLEASLKRLNTLIKDDKWLDKDDNRKALTILGVRIPVQGQGSIDAAEIYEFLPPGAGNIIVLPSEIVGKSGGDFDFDKLPSLFPRISKSGKIISASTYTTKQDVRNRISELEKELNLDRKDVKKYVKEIINFLKADKKVTEEQLDSVANILEYVEIRRDFIVEDINKLIALDIENGQSKFLPKPLQKALSKPNYEDEDIIKALRISSKILNKKGENILERFNKRLYSKIQEFNKLNFEELKPLIDQIKQIERVRNEFNKAINRSSDFLSEIKYVLDVERNFTGALQTDLLETATDILLSPENYVSLVTPNSTDIFDDLAAELKRKTQTYNPLERLTTTKNTGVISPTRLFESEYNISKYEAYMTAMDALGIGAIMNTYNVLLNSLGAVSPESYDVKIGKDVIEIPVRILMPHQKRGKRISLSNTYTAKTKDAASHKISDVFNQMINGWVDVGKDPWIFYIQGNKEITPVLMYMIMAGVPVEYAVYFVSQPIIREFVKVKASTSKEEALKQLLGQKSVARIINDSQQKVTEDFKLADLKSQLDPSGYDKDYQEKVLYHFVEILNMSDAFTKFTRATNVDTTRENTYLSTRSREAAIAELSYDGRIDPSLIEAIQNPEKSILGGFFIGDFAIALAKEVLPFRFMSEVDDFINSKSNDSAYRDLAKAKTSGKNNGNEILNSLFRNDLILALYQNAVRGFTLGSSTSYNGIGVTRDTPVKYADFLKSGVHIAFENGVPVIMVDANQIYKMYNDQALKNDNFKNFYPTVDDYARFLIEYSILDYTNPELDSETKKVNRANFKSLNSYAIFQNQRNSFARILNKLALKNQALREQFVVLQSLFVESVEGYDTITLKDKGLDNITGTSYYNELKALKDFNAVKQRVPSLSDDSIKTINFLFRMLPQVIFLQEGLNKNFSNLVNLIDFKTEINPIIQNAINTINQDQKDQKESFQNFLESFYASFMENNRIGNKIPVKIYRNRDKAIPVPGAYTRFIPEKIRGQNLRAVRSKKMNNLLFMQLRGSQKPYDEYDRIIDQSSNVIYVVYPTVLNQEKAAKSSYIRNSKTKARYIPIAIGFNNIEDGFVEGGEQTVKQQPQPKQYRTEKIISDEDVRLFNQYRGNRALPEEFFTSKTRFKEFYNRQTGKRETAPQNTKWFLNEKNLYDLIDQETGELYISDVDLSTGLRYIEVQPTQPSTNLPGPGTTINIYSRDKNGFENLSNLLNGPVKAIINGKELTFKTVEHLYQVKKALFAGDKSAANEIFKSPRGSDAQRLGTAKGPIQWRTSTPAEWDKVSTQELKSAMRLAFEQNQNARDLLLKTGDAQLTHKTTFSLGKWETVFPEILMEIREELRATQPSTSVKPIVKDLTRWSELSAATTPYTDKGIVVTRIANTDEHFGNPFIGSKRRDKQGNIVESKVDNITTFNTIDEADQAYRDWLMGTKHKNIQPKRREWILKQINEGKLDGKTLLYYKPMEVTNNDGTVIRGGYHSHADTLAEVVEELRATQLTQSAVQPGQETTFTLQGKNIKLGRNQSNINNSGAARGADAYFNFRSADYPVSNMNWHNQDMLKRAKEGKGKDLIIGLMENNPQALITDESEYAKVVQIGASRLGKAAKNPATINKLGRNWYQIKNSDAVFAIVESFYTRPDTGNLDMANVSGGTGWAIAYAAEKIDGRERPIYVFNQSDNKWYQYDYIDEIFKEYSGIPKLTKNFAGIGTRKINEAGKKAIDNLYANTFRATQPSTQTRTFKDEEYHQAYVKGGLDAVQKLIQKNKQKEMSAAKQLSKEVDMLTEFEELNSKPDKTNSENDRLIDLYVMLKNSKELDFEYSLNQLGLSTQPSTQPTVQPSQIEYTPENITSLKSNEVFVFGSNTEGKHGDGAAKTAVDKFGAKYGEPKGLQGQSYAIITKDLSKGKRSVSLDSIYNQVIDLNDRAKVRDDLKFYVTKFGTDLAGFTTEEIKQIWQDIHENYIIADNIVLPKEFEVRDKQPTVQGVSSNVEVVSPDYGVVVVETNPSLTKTEEFVKIIQPQIEAQAYKENTSGAANDMFMYQLRWTRKKNALAPLNNRSYANNGLPITDAKSKDSYVYDTVDQNGNPLPPVSDLQQIIDEIQNSLGIDMSDYDAVIGNIYLPGQNIATHRDTTESLSARNYPVIVYTIGNDSGIGIYEDKENPGSPSFRSDSRKEIPTKNGTIYTFGMDGKGRFELAHDTPKDVKRDKKFPPITLPNGTVIENYTITLTFRRAADLTPGMPTSPRKITRGVTKTPLQTPSITDAKTPNVEQAKKIIDQQLAKIEEVLSNPENNVIMDNSLLISQKTKEIAGDYAGSKAIADYLYGEIYKRFGLPISGTGKFSVRELIRENQQGIEGVESDKINKEDLNGLDLDGTCFRA